MNYLDITKKILSESLQITADREEQLASDTPLLGSMPEFNSMAVVVLVTAIEEKLGCAIDDDEISEDVFETVGALAAFIESKMS